MGAGRDLMRVARRRLRSVGRGSTATEAPARTAITRLFRNPPQLALLATLLGPQRSSSRVRIYGVADGAEAVSLLVALAPPEHATLVIEGVDISEAYLHAAEDLVFTPEHFAEGVDPADHHTYLEAVDDGWRLGSPWRRFLRFSHGDVLDAGHAAPVDLVMCQNTLVGFPAGDAARAVAGLVAEVRPGGLLAVGGGQLDVVPAAVRSHGLAPVLDDVEAIHEAWVVQRRFYDNPRRPWWALEPFDPDHPDGPTRYCTVFRKAVDR